MIAVGLLMAHVGVCAALLAGSRVARGAALVLGVAAAGLAWLAPDELPAVRAVVALGALWVLAKLIDIVATPCERSYGWRLWYLTSPFDARLSRPCERALARDRLVAVIGYGALAAVGGVVAFALAPELVGVGHYACRWGGAMVTFYAGVEATVAAITVAHARFGVEVPLIQDAPILARSVGEFWSRRWNRPVSRWLRMHCFAPLARRGWPLTGVMLAFAVSGYLHFHFVWAGVGLSVAALMGLFFVVQVPIVLAERVLAVRRWPVVAQRTWTIGLLASSSPLFLEPMLGVIAATSG